MSCARSYAKDHPLGVLIALSGRSDQELAEDLLVGQETVCSWRQGHTSRAAVVYEVLAQLAQVPPGEAWNASPLTPDQDAVLWRVGQVGPDCPSREAAALPDGAAAIRWLKAWGFLRAGREPRTLRLTARGWVRVRYLRSLLAPGESWGVACPRPPAPADVARRWLEGRSLKPVISETRLLRSRSRPPAGYHVAYVLV